MPTKTILHLGPADQGRKVTHEDFAEAVFEEPWRYERVKGRLSVMTPSGHDHSHAAEVFLENLFVYKAAHPDRIAHVRSEAWIRIDELNERIADIGVYLPTSRSELRIPDAKPDIVVEIASEGYTSLKRDYEEKREDYYRAGMREYVIVDRFEHRVTVLRRSRGKFVETILGPGDKYTTSLLPGLEIPLQAVLSSTK